MFPIVETRFLAPGVKLFRVEAPRVARERLAGQFVIVRIHEEGEHIPLTIADSSLEDGTVTLIVHGVGKTAKLMNRLGKGDALLDLAGPLGKPTEVERFGTVAVVGGGVGTAIAWPSAVALKKAGNRVVSILGARTWDLVLLEEEINAVSDLLIVTTEDGSNGLHGLVTQALADRIAAEPIDCVYAMGSVPMMKAVADVTRPFGIPTLVSLNPILVEGAGMRGGRRALAGGESRFASMDGPELDAHEVDFRVLLQRNAAYQAEEKISLDASLQETRT